MWNVRRSWQISTAQSNYAELLGKPTDTVEVLDYPLSYYGPEQSWLLSSHWGLYAPILWMSYGILHPPEEPMSWPPTTPPKDVLKMLPPEVKSNTDREPSRSYTDRRRGGSSRRDLYRNSSTRIQN